MNIRLFYYLSFPLLDIYKSHGRRGRERPISTPLYDFHSLNKHLDIKWRIAAESSPLHAASDRTQTVNLWCLSVRFITKRKYKVENTECKKKKKNC